MFVRHCCSCFFLNEKEYLLYSKRNGKITINSWCDLGAVRFSSGLILFFFFHSSVFFFNFLNSILAIFVSKMYSRLANGGVYLYFSFTN